jgi:hypothetical protein
MVKINSITPNGNESMITFEGSTINSYIVQDFIIRMAKEGFLSIVVSS